jgi:tRNA 2-thiouridine synthesizing protein A
LRHSRLKYEKEEQKMSVKADQTLNAKGLACPMPIVKSKKAIDQLESGQVLEIHATDKGAKSDLTAWAKSGGHELLEHTEEDDVLKFWVKKG